MIGAAPKVIISYSINGSPASIDWFSLVGLKKTQKSPGAPMIARVFFILSFAKNTFTRIYNSR